MTFEREVMAGLCLAIVWVNSLLIVAHGLADLRRLAALRRRLAGSLGRWSATTADDGPSYRLVQSGRSRGDGTIHFHDRKTESAFQGDGQVERAQGQFELTTGAGIVWVWPTQAEVDEQARCASQEEYDALARSALHARGAERVVTVKLRAATVAGGELIGGRLTGTQANPLIFSSIDPGARLLGLELRMALGLTAILLVLGALTALCFVGPAFGLFAKAGALSLFGYFLAVQPIGVWLSESVRWPHEVARGGAWVRARVPERTHSDLARIAPSN